MYFLKTTRRKIRFCGTHALPGILCALFLLSIIAHAAPPLTAEIKPVAVRARTGAPETLDVRLTWSGSGLLEGALELSFPDADENAPLIRSHDLALTTGAKDFRLLIPSASAGGAGSLRAVRARFNAKSGVLDLGRFDFAGQRGGERDFTICVVRPELTRAPGDYALWRSLRLERFQPATTNYRSLSASTLPVYVDPKEAPANPLAYTSYDIVLLEGATFTELREKQLAALSRWALAGGSLCVIADTPLETGHRRFLTDLLAADPRSPTIDVDAQGRVFVKEEGGVLLARSGFGRFVVAASEPRSDTDADTMLWKRAATFLWKFREGQSQSAVGSGTWTIGENDLEPWRRDNAQQQLANVLAPKNVRILPYPVMLVVLAAFVIVIGPADWMVLGKFRLRRLTWLVFPLAAVAFTAITVVLAGRYMGRKNYRSQLTLTDLGHDGRVMRETRFEMIFPASAQEVTTDVRNALCVPVSNLGNYYSNRPKLVPGTYEGLFPARYIVRQSLSQWAPQLNRLTSIEANDDDSGLDWAQLRPESLTLQSIRERFGDNPSWEFFKLHGGEFTAFQGNTLLPDLVRFLSQPRPSGSLTVCSQVSPSGATRNETADFEDLPLAGIGDKEVSATIAARRDGENFHIYRHLYAP